MQYNIDTLRIEKNRLVIMGWAAGKYADDGVVVTLKTSHDDHPNYEYKKTGREDVRSVKFPGTFGSSKFGFNLIIEYDEEEVYTLCFDAHGEHSELVINKKYLKSYFRKEWFAHLFVKREKKKLGVKRRSVWLLYALFMHKNVEFYANKEREPAKEIAEFSPKDSKYTFTFLPIWSKEKERHKKVTLASLERQTHLVYEALSETEGMNIESIRKSLEKSRGDYVVVMTSVGDWEYDFLEHCIKCIKENPSVKLIYGDECEISPLTKILKGTSFKPDFSPDYLREKNYIGSYFVVKKSLLEKIISEMAAENVKYENPSSYMYDIALRVYEDVYEDDIKENGGMLYTSESITHLPRVYLRRFYKKNFDVMNQEDANIVYRHCVRMGLKPESVTLMGTRLKCVYQHENQLVSVVIPNKDHTDDLDTAIRSLMKGTYQNLEFIVVENNSTEEKTFKYYEEIQKEFPNVKVVFYSGIFNYSKINNYGVQYTNGEYILLLNNDIENITPSAVGDMVGYISRKEVGIVGAKLLYDDYTIQHAGVIVGAQGIAGHAFVGLPDTSATYMDRADCVHNLSAVTAACLMVKKSVFLEVGGLNEELAVAFNDIDFCLRVREHGYLVVYDPHVKMLHYESKSRGAEDTPEKRKRFNSEVRAFAFSWKDMLREGDPYYNRNLSLMRANYMIRDWRKEPFVNSYLIEFDIDQ